jgi:hypothetical protein
MSKKLFLMISFVLLPALTGSASARDIQWTDANGSGLWNDANNWSPAAVPAIAMYDKAKIMKLAPKDAHINAGMAAECQWLVVGDGKSGGLHMTGGTLNVSGLFDSWTIVAYDVNGVFTMDGGTVTTSNRFYVGFQRNGTLNMNGGTMNIGGTFGIGYGENFTTGRGYVYLNGGTINVTGGAGLIMSSPAGCLGYLDIDAGTLTINGDEESLVNDYIANGWITAYGSLGTILVDYNITEPNKTTVRAYFDPQKARCPNPAHDAVDVIPDVTLSWTAGDGAVSHDVYFGTDANSVRDANTSTVGIYKGSQPHDANTYGPMSLELDKKYYWRIDEVNEANVVTTGNIWSFTTISGKAASPSPTNGETNVAINPTLSWVAGFGATSHDVYFGTMYPGTFQDNQPGTSFNPGTLAPNTTYYWRIDEVGGYGTITGTVWSFTTVQTKAANPCPANSAVNVPVTATLSWTAGSGAVSHDVYFDTSNPPTFYGNQTTTTFEPNVLNFNTTYYWRIDEANGPNTVTGDLWTFTTTSGLAENPDPVSGAINVGRGTVLRWTAGYGAASHDVYLGTSLSSITNAERPTGDLDGDGQVDYNDLFILTNYWLQDPAGSEPYAGTNGDNIVDFTDFSLLADNWMGQGSPFKGSTNATSYDDPCDFELNTTYYWRVDEICGPEKRKGNVWSFTVTDTNSNYTLVGKIMCGYQGWFNCPGDGTPRGWVHWSKSSSSFTPSNVHVDLWPDMNEMSAGEKFLASAFYDGNDYYVFSSYNRNTVLRHFQWMQDYGIDGVYLQRFATEVTPGSAAFNHRNAVLSYCKDGANLYGRVYAVMYDLSGLSAGGTAGVINDWKFLVDTMKVSRNPNDHHGYMFHKGKPVVAVWGIGFPGRAYTHQECYNLVNFLKNDPCYGGNIVMIGVNDDWNTNPDSWVQMTVALADIISPWTVGRYASGGVNNWATTKEVPDKNWCNINGKEYLPVIWPGYSFWNASNHSMAPLNKYPRYGGQFLWDQVYSAVVTVDANMIYVAMFDEVDEGTAIFKITNDPPRPGGVDMFVTPDFDGYPLPSDEYLWLTGQAGRGLRGEIPVLPTRPAR